MIDFDDPDIKKQLVSFLQSKWTYAYPDKPETWPRQGDLVYFSEQPGKIGVPATADQNDETHWFKKTGEVRRYFKVHGKSDLFYEGHWRTAFSDTDCPII